MAYQLPPLPYDYNALEPYLDEETMRIHHDKHHQVYLDKFNAALENYPDLHKKKPEDLLANLEQLLVSDNDREKIKNYGGGYVNHNLYWAVMGPKKQIDEKLSKEIESAFGSMDEFKKVFGDAAKSHFGSGWAWLVRDAKGTLKVYSLPNQDSPLTLGHTPILTLDVWEHAYYLKYRNKRPDFVDAWWNAVKII